MYGKLDELAVSECDHRYTQNKQAAAC